MIEIKGTNKEIAKALEDSGFYPWWIILNLNPGIHVFRRNEVDIKVIIEEEQKE